MSTTIRTPAPCAAATSSSKSSRRAELGVYVAVVGNVVAAVGEGGRIERAEPDRVHAETGQIADPGGETGEVADAIAVAVGEAARVDLIDDRLSPPVGVQTRVGRDGEWQRHGRQDPRRGRTGWDLVDVERRRNSSLGTPESRRQTYRDVPEVSSITVGSGPGADVPLISMSGCPRATRTPSDSPNACCARRSGSAGTLVSRAPGGTMILLGRRCSANGCSPPLPEQWPATSRPDPSRARCR